MLPDPLTLTPVFIDFETLMTSAIKLSKMSQRRYLAQSRVNGMAYKIGDGPTEYLPDEAAVCAVVPVFAALFARDDVVFVAHNEPFDSRVWRLRFNMPPPRHAICTMELAQCAVPNHPGGYSLANLSRTIAGMPPKLDIDLAEGRHTLAELERYCRADVDACAALYRICLPRIPQVERRIALLTAETRRYSVRIDQAQGAQAVQDISTHLHTYAQQAADLLGASGLEDLEDAFGLTAGELRSVKPEGLKARLFETFGVEFQTISMKKINPEKLRQNPEAAAVLQAAGKANSILSSKRRVADLASDDRRELTLRFFGSHTGRWTSTAEGKGINFLNLPKHDPVIAPMVRRLLTLEDHDGTHLLLVRGDAAALEYRMNGLLSGCDHIRKLYEADVFADPYVAFGKEATGTVCGKKDPARKVWKETVLGLGFLMGVLTHALRLARLLSDEAVRAQRAGKPPGITLADLEAMCKAQRWHPVWNKQTKNIRTRTGLADAIITVAYYTHGLFHEIHPEMRRLAGWLETAAAELSRTRDPDRVLDQLYRRHAAPPRELINITVDDGVQGRSLRIGCGPHPPTLMWRDLGVRADAFGQVGLCSVRAGNRGYRRLTPNILIENVVQTAGRNPMAKGLLLLRERGFFPPLNVHDEALVPVFPRTACVLEARAAMLDVFRPGGEIARMGYGWACVMAPDEVTVSRTFYEKEPNDIAPDFWRRLAAGEDNLLDLLP